ncbi:MAG: hypothetical protein ACP5GJ_03940 [Nanopusillaceae archaeon]
MVADCGVGTEYFLDMVYDRILDGGLRCEYEYNKGMLTCTDANGNTKVLPENVFSLMVESTNSYVRELEGNRVEVLIDPNFKSKVQQDKEHLLEVCDTISVEPDIPLLVNNSLVDINTFANRNMKFENNTWNNAVLDTLRELNASVFVSKRSDNLKNLLNSLGIPYRETVLAYG